MTRIEQSLEEILTHLSELPTVLKDELAERIIRVLQKLPSDRRFERNDLERLFAEDFEATMNAMRLFLDKSKDELETQLRAIYPPGIRPTRTAFTKATPQRYVNRNDTTPPPKHCHRPDRAGGPLTRVGGMHRCPFIASQSPAVRPSPNHHLRRRHERPTVCVAGP